jgi:hypothetical protein
MENKSPVEVKDIICAEINDVAYIIFVVVEILCGMQANIIDREKALLQGEPADLIYMDFPKQSIVEEKNAFYSKNNCMSWYIVLGNFQWNCSSSGNMWI